MEHKSEDSVKKDEKELKKNTKRKILSLSSPLLSCYFSFRKNFYTEVKETEKMNPEEVVAYRKQLGLEIFGKDVPNPIKTWQEAGVPSRVLDTLSDLNYVKPMPIQTQVLPVIMSGLDCICVAKKGSGKTLAYILPMIRQLTEPSARIHGAIGLIIAPTKDIVQQIYANLKILTYLTPCLTCVAVYTSGVLERVSEFRTGPGVVVCTPELCAVIGEGELNIPNRITYLVLDEVDCMIDMGFESQILGVLRKTRRDRQTVVCSATFPPEVKAFAQKVVIKPAVEIHHVVNKQDHHEPGGGDVDDIFQQSAATRHPSTGGVAVAF